MRFIYVQETPAFGSLLQRYYVTPYYSGMFPGNHTRYVGQILDTNRILFCDGSPDAEFLYIGPNGELITAPYYKRMNGTREIRNALLREMQATVPVFTRSEVQAQVSDMMRMFNYDVKYRHRDLQAEDRRRQPRVSKQASRATQQTFANLFVGSLANTNRKSHMEVNGVDYSNSLTRAKRKYNK